MNIESLFGVLLIDWLMTLMIIKDEVSYFCVCMCRCVHMYVELGWVCGVKRRFFDDFFLVFYGIGVFLSFRISFSFISSPKFFSEVKHVTRKHCALNILSGRSGNRWSIKPSVGRSGGQREKGQRWMLLCFFLPVLFVEETFLQRETRLT